MYMRFMLQIITLIAPVGGECYIAFIPLISYKTDIDTIIPNKSTADTKPTQDREIYT